MALPHQCQRPLQNYKHWKVGLFKAIITQKTNPISSFEDDPLDSANQIIQRPVAILKKLGGSRMKVVIDLNTGLMICYNSANSSILEYSKRMLTEDWTQLPVKLVENINFCFQREDSCIDLSADLELAEIAVDLIKNHYAKPIRTN